MAMTKVAAFSNASEIQMVQDFGCNKVLENGLWQALKTRIDFEKLDKLAESFVTKRF